MSKSEATTGTAKYFAVLGLGTDAGESEIEARYQELSAYLTSTDLPSHLQDWAREQASLVDEAYAILSDPDTRAGLEEEPAPPPPPAPAAVSAAAPASTASAAPDRPRVRLPLMALAFGILIGGAALVAVIVAEVGFNSEGSEDPAAEAQAQDQQFIPVDTERVAELIKSYQEDQTNPETLFELGEAYFLAGEWQQGLEWFLKLAKVDPENVHAWTDIGTAYYNTGKTAEAQAAWQKGIKLAPEDPQLHYNMGFLYANSEKPDFAAAKKEWQTVLKLAPGTQLAQTVQVHMEGLQASPSPEAAAAP
jgi:tetratricopeptide (TPR) repeat protein